MGQYPAWSKHTALPVTRYDHSLPDNGIVIQTLFHLGWPYLEHQATARTVRESTVLGLTTGLVTSPTAVRLLQIDETQFQPVKPMALNASHVELRKIMAFSANGWVYRVEECWGGPTVEAAELARQNSEPDVRVTVELLTKEYGQAVRMRDRDDPASAEFAYIVGSALGKVRDLANNSPRTVERTRFAPPPAVPSCSRSGSE